MFESIDQSVGPINVSIDQRASTGEVVLVGRDIPEPGDAGIELPRRCAGTVATSGGYVVNLDIEVLASTIRPSRVDICADAGGLLDPVVISEVGFHLYSLVEEVLVAWWISTNSAAAKKTRERVREIVQVMMMPRQGDEESWPAYVYRLWVGEYQPSGRTQAHLAHDLGRSVDLVRKYVSQESRAQAKRRRETVKGAQQRSKK